MSQTETLVGSESNMYKTSASFVDFGTPLNQAIIDSERVSEDSTGGFRSIFNQYIKHQKESKSQAI